MQRVVGLLHFGGNSPGPNYWQYRPDSDWCFDSHPEVRLLLPRWLRNNRANNAGDLARYYSLILNLKQLQTEQVPGDFAELGVYRGNSAAVLAHFAAAAGRRLYLFDTFEGFDARDFKGPDQRRDVLFAQTSLRDVAKNVGHSDSCTYVQGYFPDSIKGQHVGDLFAFVHLDCDLYQPMKEGLAYFYPRVAPGGMILMHDYSSGYWDGARLAVDEFCRSTGEPIVLLPDKSGSAVLRKRRS
jgi:hypothetical protein